MGVIRTVAKGLRASLLAAGLSAQGCYPLPEECRKSNESKTFLPVQETDGEVASFHELMQPDQGGKILSRGIIDFINETHALTDEYLPEVNVSLVPEHCRNGQPYSIVDGGLDYERGIYVPWPTIGIGYLLYFNHELGHFQRRGQGNETIAELNSLEQSMGMIPLFYALPDQMEQLVWWSWLYPNGVGTHLTLNGFTSNDNEYVQSDILIHSLLRARNGDYRAVREALEEIIEVGVLRELTEQAVAVFDGEHSLDQYRGNELARKADIVLQARVYNFREVERKYGQDIAQAYFDASSHFMYPFAQNATFPFSRDDYILSTTMDSFNCRVIGVSRGQPIHSPARGAHPSPITSTHQMETTANLCCFTINADTSSQDSFLKWAVRAAGTTYWNDARTYLQVPELKMVWPYAVNDLEIQAMQPLRWKDPCREL